VSESDPIRVYVRNGKWLIDYGSYAQGWYHTRNEAIEVASAAALREHRELTIEREAIAPDPGPDLLEPSSAVLH
jgi:hypothetical protein